MRKETQGVMLRPMLLVIFTTGCGTGLFMSEDESRKDWEAFLDNTMVATIDSQIEAEIAGEKPNGSVESWNIHWLLRIKAMSEDLEENQKYIDYVIDSREMAGLPPLEGYPLKRQY